MIAVLRSSWPLLLGVLLLLLGNGMQGTVLGLRGAMEGYDAPTMSWVMSAYFAGFLIGARLTPRMIRRVGHVRVFAALGAVPTAAMATLSEAATPVSSRRSRSSSARRPSRLPTTSVLVSTVVRWISAE